MWAASVRTCVAQGKCCSKNQLTHRQSEIKRERKRKRVDALRHCISNGQELVCVSRQRNKAKRHSVCAHVPLDCVCMSRVTALRHFLCVCVCVKVGSSELRLKETVRVCAFGGRLLVCVCCLCSVCSDVYVARPGRTYIVLACMLACLTHCAHTPNTLSPTRASGATITLLIGHVACVRER